jgi:hypothetical protein
VAIHHHLLDRGVGEQLLERAEADRLTQDQLAEPSTGSGLEDRRVRVDQLTDRRRQRHRIGLPRGGLGATAFDQPTTQLGSEQIQVAAADWLVHPPLRQETRLTRPRLTAGKGTGSR